MSILINESYDGQVVHVAEETVVVVYRVNNDLVEQTYVKDQFKGGKFPSVGTCLRVSVTVVEYEPDPPDPNDLINYPDDRHSHRQAVTGDIRF